LFGNGWVFHCGGFRKGGQKGARSRVDLTLLKDFGCTRPNILYVKGCLRVWGAPPGEIAAPDPSGTATQPHPLHALPQRPGSAASCVGGGSRRRSDGEASPATDNAAAAAAAAAAPTRPWPGWRWVWPGRAGRLGSCLGCRRSHDVCSARQLSSPPLPEHGSPSVVRPLSLLFLSSLLLLLSSQQPPTKTPQPLSCSKFDR